MLYGISGRFILLLFFYSSSCSSRVDSRLGLAAMRTPSSIYCLIYWPLSSLFITFPTSYGVAFPPPNEATYLGLPWAWVRLRLLRTIWLWYLPASYTSFMYLDILGDLLIFYLMIEYELLSKSAYLPLSPLSRFCEVPETSRITLGVSTMTCLCY